MDVSTILAQQTQQAAQQTEAVVNLVKQSSESDAAAVGLVEQALQVAKEANKGTNVNIVV